MGTTAAPGKQIGRPVAIVDCDPGIDDALALFVARQHLSVVGITCVSGNVPVAQCVDNALGIAALMDWSVPVYTGAADALVVPTRNAAHVHGADGLGGLVLPSATQVAASESAVDFILRASAAHDDLWLVALGPLTNLALALAQDPGLASRLAGISLMGGSAGPGNVTAVAEFNFWADPHAAEQVLSSGARIVMCGLDLTHQFCVDDQWFKGLADSGHRVADDFARGAIRYLLERMGVLRGERVAAIHDPCAVLALSHPQLFQFVERAVNVETVGALTEGMSVVDERQLGAARQSPTNVRLARKIDARAGLDILRAALLAGPAKSAVVAKPSGQGGGTVDGHA